MRAGIDEVKGGPISRLLMSLRNFAATLLTIGRTRMELLTVELQLEVRRAGELLAWGFLLLFGVSVTLVMAGVAVIVTFWDTHRVLAATLVTAAYLVLAATAAFVLFRKLRKRPRMLQGTLSQLERDVDSLRGRT